MSTQKTLKTTKGPKLTEELDRIRALMTETMDGLESGEMDIKTARKNIRKANADLKVIRQRRDD